MDLREINTSKKYPTGSKWKTKEGYTITVLGQSNKECNSGYYVYAQFYDGHIIEVRNTVMDSGSIKNSFHKSVAGVGYLGEFYDLKRGKVKFMKEYTTWRNMIKRCYETRDRPRDRCYKDCTVDPFWHSFNNFYNDISSLEGYSEWIKPNSKYALDKDIKFPKNKVYSKNTCMFVSGSENSGYHSYREFEATKIETGEKITFNSVSEFATKHKLNLSNLSKAIHTDNFKYSGWTFREIFE